MNTQSVESTTPVRLFLFLLLSFILFSISPAVISAERECDEQIIDSCASNLFIYGNPDRRFGSTEQEVANECRKSRESVSCLQDIVRRCYKRGLVKQYFQIMMRAPTQVMKKSCSKTGIQEVLKHNTCLQASKAPLDMCTVTAITDSMRILHFANESNWLTASCCFLDKARDCLKVSVHSTKSCSAESKSYILKQANEFLGESMELTCGNNYNHKDTKCTGVMTSLPELPKTIKRPQTVIPVTIGVMAKFLS